MTARPANAIYQEIRYGIVRGAFAHASGEERSHVMNTLYEMHENKNRYKKLAADLALHVQVAPRHIEAVETHEDDMIRLLRMQLLNDPYYNDTRSAWFDITVDDRIALVRRVVDTQATVFEFTPAQEIVTFSMSRAEHKAFVKKHKLHGHMYPREQAITAGNPLYPQIAVSGQNAIALNVHADALNNLNDHLETICMAVHAQSHLHQAELIAGKAHPQSGYSDIVAGMDVDNPWMDDKDVGETFRRCCLAERHATSLEDKFRARLTMGPIVPERRQLEAFTGHLRLV